MVGNWGREDTLLSSGTPGCLGLGWESNACPEPCSGAKGSTGFPLQIVTMQKARGGSDTLEGLSAGLLFFYL